MFSKTTGKRAENRALTRGEIALARGVFGDAIDYRKAALARRKWAFFQPRGTVMAPMGTIHFHPDDPAWRADFAAASLPLQRLFIHEMTHVWQAQTRGRWWLPLMRHPFCRYGYRFLEGRPLASYGIEQQAELVADAFMAGRGLPRIDGPTPVQLARVLPFAPDSSTSV